MNTEHGAGARRGRLVRRAGCVVAVVAAIAAAAAGGLWLLRDAPRRWLEARLARQLESEVRLGRLRIEGRERFVLEDLVVRRPAWEPRLAEVTIGRLLVRGSLGEIRGGHYELLSADNVDALLVPAPREPAAAGAAAAGGVTVDLIEVRGGRLAIEADGARERLRFEATVRDWARGPTGHLSVEARDLGLAAPAAVAAEIEPLRAIAGGSMDAVKAEVSWERDPLAISVELEAAGAVMPLAGGVWRLDEPVVHVTATRATPGGGMRITGSGRSRDLESAAFEAALTEAGALRDLRFTLTGVDAARLRELLPPAVAGEIAGRLDVTLRTADGERFEFDAAGSIERWRASPVGVEVTARDGQVEARGTWRPSAAPGSPAAAPWLDFRVEASAGGVAIDGETAAGTVALDALALAGTLDATGGGPLSGRATLAGGRLRWSAGDLPPELFPLRVAIDGRLGAAAPAAFEGRAVADTPLTGELHVTGRTAFLEAGPVARWRWRWPRLPDARRLAAVAGAGTAGLADVDGRLRAAGTLEGPLADPAVTAVVDVEGLRLVWREDPDPAAGRRSLVVRSATGGARLSRGSGGGSGVSVESLELRGQVRAAPSPAATDATGEPLEPASVNVELSARGRLDPLAGTAAVERGRIELPPDGVPDGDAAEAELEGELHAGGRLTAEMRLAPVSLGRVRESLRDWLDDPAPAWDLTGRLEATLSAIREPGGPWRIAGEAGVTEAGFSSTDGSRVVQGLESAWQLSLSGAAGSGWSGTATGRLQGPQLLWGTLYGDYSELASRLELGLAGAGPGWEAELGWSLPRGVRAAGRLEVAPVPAGAPDTATDHHPGARLRYGVDLAVPDLGAFLETYVRVPFDGSVDGIQALQASGAMRVELAGARTAGSRSFGGRVGVSGASLSGRDGSTRVEALELDLPFELAWTGDGDGPSGEPHSGRVSFESLRLGGVDFSPVDAALASEADSVRLGRAIELELLGGELGIEALSLVDWSRPSRHLRFGLVLDSLGLGPLTEALDVFPLAGDLNGVFPVVRMTPERLVVDGGGELQVFGGRVAVFDISGQDVTSRFPRLEFSADFEGIRLIELSHTFDFGEVHGVVAGRIRDCELFRGTPVRCEAAIHSVKTPGVPQKIDVKAINNIAILGSGSGVLGLLDRGLRRFLDTYTYQAIGIHTTLRDDRFVLRGTERRGDRELFVKGRLPFRIDVVNVAPGQGVSFRTMLDRLQELEISTGRDGHEPEADRGAGPGGPPPGGWYSD